MKWPVYPSCQVVKWTMKLHLNFKSHMFFEREHFSALRPSYYQSPTPLPQPPTTPTPPPINKWPEVDFTAQFNIVPNLHSCSQLINKNAHTQFISQYWHFVEHIMGWRFLLAFFTLFALFSILHARTDGSAFITDPGPPNLKSRSLLSEKTIADPPSAPLSDDEERKAIAEAPTEWESRKMGRHHSSEAGGGVIIGGLVTAIFAAVYCYIRVTRRRSAENFTWNVCWLECVNRVD